MAKFTITSEKGTVIEFDTATMIGITVGLDDKVFDISITEINHGNK